MSLLANIYFKKEVLEDILKVLNTKREKGVSVDISISDITNEHGQNVSAYVSQNKEDREAKKKRFYVGNGKVFWTNGRIELATKTENKPEPQPEPFITDTDDLPF